MMGFCFVISAAMLIIGYAFYTGMAVKFIKDYQDMEEKEKQNIKIGVLCKNISILFFIVSVIFGIAGFSEVFRQIYFRWVMLGWFALGAADVIYIGKSKRFVHVYTPVVKGALPDSKKRKKRRC
jgi:4-hydroxybenzoate polyprenyltransferase